MRPKISIIIPCYNLGRYITPCLESISRQHAGDMVEYIFVNDGSTDNTLSVLKDFISRNDYCKLIDQSNAGVSAARNAAIEASTGEYIYLLDGDDILTEGAVLSMIKDVEAGEPDAVISRAKRLREGEVYDIPFPFKEGFFTPVDLYKSCKYFHAAPQLLYKRSIIADNNLKFNPSLKLGEVYDFTVRFLNKSYRISVITSCYFIYVTRSTSATQNPVYERDLSIINTVNEYNLHGGSLANIASFKLTNFKVMMSFTYVKYLKQRLNTPETRKFISTLLKNRDARKIIKTLVKTSHTSIRDRILGLYMLTTGSIGYGLLAYILKKKK